LKKKNEKEKFAYANFFIYLANKRAIKEYYQIIACISRR
jgi:hypothetical protein